MFFVFANSTSVYAESASFLRPLTGLGVMSKEGVLLKLDIYLFQKVSNYYQWRFWRIRNVLNHEQVTLPVPAGALIIFPMSQ